ncbi:GxxExxY protein [Telluribacter sp. SYSU D00476]|uniref:GxxExxY protein n=1 Tax=Telluribacter sp. SYSU D00476 TaxID=2811430 RepID=UPI00286EACEA|nr:GxxExxY protein [Telluribacter sp. SYSU D00476]
MTHKVLNCAFEVHTALGPGLLESAYKKCLFYELTLRGIYVEKEKPMPLVFKEVKLDCGYRIDLFVENQLVVELKAIDAIHDVHIAQVLTYMRLSNSKVGLLLNFNVTSLKNGIKRLAL